MRLLLKLLLGLAAMCAVLAGIGCLWFYLYSDDIPAFAALENFAPVSTRQVDYDCAETAITAVSYSRLGDNVQNATRAAEGDDQLFSRRIALRLFCNYKNQTQSLFRHLLESKASAQIQRRFTSEQILAIYLNGAYFGDGIFGIEGASQHYYGKSSSDLDVAQSAMLAGMLQHPSAYSPKSHPDTARTRRNAIVAAMVRKGAITPAQGQVAIESDVR